MALLRTASSRIAYGSGREKARSVTRPRHEAPRTCPALTGWLGGAQTSRGSLARKGHAMRFGVCVMANIDEIGFFPHAEALGFDSVWVTDSQMLFSDCYVVLAL